MASGSSIVILSVSDLLELFNTEVTNWQTAGQLWTIEGIVFGPHNVYKNLNSLEIF